MATVTLSNFIAEKVVNGLNTYQYTVATAAVHVAKIRVPVTPPSGLSIVINQNGSPIATATVPAALQTHMELTASINCAVNDIITWVLTSSTASDEQLNTIQAILNLHVGSLN